MTVIKEAEIHILSVIENLDDAGLVDGDAEKTESSCVGYLHCFDSSYLITYVEKQQDAEVVTEIKLGADGVRVLRRGAIESDITFREGYTHSSLYTVSPYKFDSEVTTKRIRSSVTQDGGRLDLIYCMKIGGAMKNARMRIDVTPR